MSVPSPGPAFTPVRVHPDVQRLREGGGVTFDLVVHGARREGFVARYQGRLVGYLNTCMHQHLPLDFGDAHFFDEDYDALVCCHHGARYRPETGECFLGPCVGSRLTPLVLEERGPELWCVGVRQG